MWSNSEGFWAVLWNNLIYLLKDDCGFGNRANLEKGGIKENLVVIWARGNTDLDDNCGEHVEKSLELVLTCEGKVDRIC